MPARTHLREPLDEPRVSQAIYRFFLSVSLAVSNRVPFRYAYRPWHRRVAIPFVFFFLFTFLRWPGTGERGGRRKFISEPAGCGHDRRCRKIEPFEKFFFIINPREISVKSREYSRSRYSVGLTDSHSERACLNESIESKGEEEASRASSILISFSVIA